VNAGVLLVTAGGLLASVNDMRGLQPASQLTTASAAADTSRQRPAVTRSELFSHPGWYVYVPDSGQIPAIKQAIDKGVAHMLPLARSIARSRLMDINKMPATLQVIVTRDSVGTQAGADKPMNLPRTGTAVQWENGSGDVCRAARNIVLADTLVQLCAADRGPSAARYVLEDNGKRLRKVVHITSPHLSGPVDYVTQFRRDSSPPGL
jgi:hypothetical protein